MIKDKITFSELSVPLKIAIVCAWLMGGIVLINLITYIIMFFWLI